MTQLTWDIITGCLLVLLAVLVYFKMEQDGNREDTVMSVHNCRKQGCRF